MNQAKKSQKHSVNIRYILPFVYVLSTLFLCSCNKSAEPAFEIEVEAEETVYEFEPADNGAGPMWCLGNTSIVRYGDQVVASGIETLEDQEPLHNVRWMLYERSQRGWELMLKDEKERTREPSPMGVTKEGKILLSVNPTLTEPGTRRGPAEPRILQFKAGELQAGHETLLPLWEGTPPFTEHSYRSFSVDGPSNELILFQNIGYTHVEWSFLGGDGNWKSQGKLEWPMGDDYEVPQPIRVCYPAVQLKDREVHFLGVSDIKEPNKAWKKFKHELTGREWDYDFRRLFYTCSKDIVTEPFQDWLEVASREKTGGHIFPCDLWVAPDGLVHILWTERALDERLQEEFFPDEKQSHALNYAIIKNGEVIFRQPIMLSEEADELLPGRGRFQVTPENRLFVFYYVHDENHDRKENRVVEVLADHSLTAPVTVELQRPFQNFFTATVRGGSAPSDIIDVYGKDEKNEMRYARIRILPL
ncbi:MAG: hypothetical protein ABFS38_01130 [Bacteroidota bacterium]